MDRRSVLRAVLVGGTVGLAGCGGDDGSDGGDENGGESPDGEDSTATPGVTESVDGDLDVSSAFADGESIPERYTADGEDVSPPLSVDGVPDDAAALAVIVDDPDAPNGTFAHWLLWNVPAETTEIPEDQPQEETLSDLGGAAQGTNDFGDIGYRGPSPPADNDPHRYQFELHALADSLDLAASAERAAVLDAVDDVHVEATTFVGVYGR